MTPKGHDHRATNRRMREFVIERTYSPDPERMGRALVSLITSRPAMIGDEPAGASSPALEGSTNAGDE